MRGQARWIGTVVVVALACGQDPARDEVRELAEALDRVHRERSADTDIRNFSAMLQLDQVAEGEDSISVGLEVDFQTVEDDGAIKHHIECRVREGDRDFERGFSELGFWTRIDDKLIYLLQAQHQQDRENIARDIRLARQLLEYLDPGDVVRSLRDPEAPTSEDFVLGRSEPIPCRVVEGLVDSFPLYRLGGDADRAHLKLWVEEASGRLIAVQATALGDHGRPDPARRELIRLSEHQLIRLAEQREDPGGTLLLPARLKFFQVDTGGTPHLQVTVGLYRIDLGS